MIEKAQELWGFVKVTWSTRMDLMLIVPGLAVYIILMGLSISFQTPRAQLVQSTQSTVKYPSRLASLVDSIQAEQLEALNVLGSQNQNLADRDILRPFNKKIAATSLVLNDVLQSFQVDDSSGAEDPSVSPFFILDIAGLEEVRLLTRTRMLTPLDAIQRYGSFQLSVIETISAFSRSALPDKIRYGYAALAAARVAWQNAETQDVFAQVNANNALTNSTIISRIAQVSALEEVLYNRIAKRLAPELVSDAADNAFSLTSPSISNILGAATSNRTWPVNTTSSPAAYFTLLSNTRSSILSRFSTSDTEVSVLSSPIALCITCIVLAGVSVVFALHQIIQAAMEAQQDNSEKTNLQQLEASYDRIQAFVDNIAAVNVDGIKAIEGKHVHTVEREIYSLEAPVRQLLSFLHPAISRSGATGLLPVPSPNEATELFPRGLTPKSVTLLLIDMEGIHAKPTTESVKILPKEYAALQTAICQILDQFEGVVHCSVGSKIIALWNHAVCNDSESTACQAAVTIQRQVPSEFSFLKFAVVSGDVGVGVCGTDSLKSFSILGQLLPLGCLLLRLNRAHNTNIIVNDATFGKLDAQSFRTRPVEMVALEATTRRSVAFELVLGAGTGSDKDGRFAAWNEAFDEYRNGNTAQGKSLLKTYITQFGESKSAQRLMYLMNEELPRHCTFRYSDDGNVDNDLL